MSQTVLTSTIFDSPIVTLEVVLIAFFLPVKLVILLEIKLQILLFQLADPQILVYASHCVEE